MSRKMYQGGASTKKGPRLAIREQDYEPPREADVRPCEWSSEEFMVNAGIKDEFDAYVCNADLEDFMQDKCPQYYYLTDSFVRMFKFSSSRNSQNVLFDIYDQSYTMDLEDFTTACKLPQWGSVNEPRKSEYKDFLASIIVGESREIAQATIGSIHFLLYIILLSSLVDALTVKMKHVTCVSLIFVFLRVLY